MGVQVSGRRSKVNSRTTHEKFDTVARPGHVMFNVFFGDEANATRPVLWGIIEDVVDCEAVGMFDSELVEFSLEENVVNVYVSVDEGDNCLVGRVLERSFDDLKHGRYASTAGDHANVV